MLMGKFHVPTNADDALGPILHRCLGAEKQVGHGTLRFSRFIQRRTCFLACFRLSIVP